VNATVHPIGTRRNTHTEATASVRERGNSRAHVRGSALKRPWQSPHGVHVKIHTTVKECLLAVAHPTQHTHAFCGLCIAIGARRTDWRTHKISSTAGE
jgi:hypothetical protein